MIIFNVKPKLMRLFSYCIPVDDGAAPNPFWDTCTLAICKPTIRRVSEVGDWVAGVGSKNVNGVDYSEKLVYAMRIDEKLTFEEYNERCMNDADLRKKIPDINHSVYERRVGDCLYDFTVDPDGAMRLGVHDESNRETDMEKGKFVLLSNHFYYFGDNAIEIREHLLGIVKQGQGHKSYANEGLKEEFVRWLEESTYEANRLHGNPQIIVSFTTAPHGCVSANTRCRAGDEDELIAIGC